MKSQQKSSTTTVIWYYSYSTRETQCKSACSFSGCVCERAVPVVSVTSGWSSGHIRRRPAAGWSARPAARRGMSSSSRTGTARQISRIHTTGPLRRACSLYCHPVMERRVHPLCSRTEPNTWVTGCRRSAVGDDIDCRQTLQQKH